MAVAATAVLVASSSEHDPQTTATTSTNVVAAERPWAKGGTPAKREGSRSHASWLGPTSFSELVQKSSFVGAVTVTNIAAGEPLPTPSNAPDVEPIQTQIVTLRIEEQWKGTDVEEIRLFKTGTDKIWITDDPPYERGQVYVLLATQRDEDGLFIPFGPEGRVEIRDGRSHSLADSPTAKTLDDKSIDDIASMIRQEME
ncbi:MAG: hypothetical protein AB7G37_14630 [Solirubrobacteraceae bacterium]